METDEERLRGVLEECREKRCSKEEALRRLNEQFTDQSSTEQLTQLLLSEVTEVLKTFPESSGILGAMIHFLARTGHLDELPPKLFENLNWSASNRQILEFMD